MNYKLTGLDITTEAKLASGELLPVMEEFYTIQGEGFNTGKAAYFIRIGGCDVGCHWCDVKESWDASIHPLTEVSELVERTNSYLGKAVVITGGEPLIYNLDHLTKKLKEKNIATFIETSGAYPLTGLWDWVCLSPKKTMAPKEEMFAKADELKIIVFNKNDFSWAAENAKKVNKDCYLYLQPEWSKREEMTPLIIEFVKENPAWRVSLQTHKFMNIP